MGFTLTSLDISQTGIAKLKYLSKERNLYIDAQVKDMRQFEFKNQYDLFVAIGRLHLIATKDRNKFI